MKREELLAWGVALADGLLIVGLAVAVGRFENGDPATTPSFNRALPYAVAALTPLAIWVGRCHALALHRDSNFLLFRVLAVGAASGAGILLILALGPLLTPDGWSQFSRAISAPRGVLNTLGEFLVLIVGMVFYAGIGMAAAFGVGAINRLIIDSYMDLQRSA
jgi:hypothetical protein